MSIATTLHHLRTITLEWMIIGAVPLLNRFRQRAEWHHSLADLRQLPDASWGACVARFLDDRQFVDFLTNYEAHDAFHTLLEYDTTVIGEMRLQAFMIGNGGASFAGRVLFVLGILLLPELWPQLRRDLHRGRCSTSVRQWQVPSLLAQNIHQLRTHIAARTDQM